MDETFLILLAGGLLLAIPTTLVLATIAWSRSRGVADLRLRVRALERELASQPLRKLGPAESRAVAPPPAAGVAQPARPPEPSGAQPAPAPTAAPSVPGARSPSPAVPAGEQRAPARTPQVPLPPPAAPPRRAPFDWERLLGVRGAAVVGGLVLALAGLLFVQHSIQQGWITPQLRVWLAGGAGLLALALSQWWFARAYRVASNALAGAGGVLIFGALWAGYRLYGMFGFGPAFAGMVATSVVLAALALRRPSRVVAVFGVLGGFATPLLVTLDSQAPIGLFGYLLALDLGLFVLSRRRGWSFLGALGALASIVVFTAHVGLRFDPATAPLALAFLGASTAALCLPALFGPRGEQRPPLAGAAVALAGSFPLALFVVARAEFAASLLPLALTCAVLVLLAGVVTRRARFPGLAQGASLGALALVLTWSLGAKLDDGAGWSLLGASALLGLVPHLLAEWDRRRKREPQVAAAALLSLGLVGVAVSLVLRVQLPLAAVLGLALLPTALLLRQAWLAGSATLLASTSLPGGALALALATARGRDLELTLDAGFSIALVALPALLVVHALLLRPVERRATAWLAAGVSALFGLGALLLRAFALRGSPWEFHLAWLGLLLIAGQAAGRRASGLLMAAAALGGAVVQFQWCDRALLEGSQVWIPILMGTAGLFALALGPRARAGELPSTAGPWIAAACAPLLWMPALLGLVFDHTSESLHPLPAVLAALPALFLFLRARGLASQDDLRALGRHARAASMGTALVLAAALPPLQFERGVSAAAFSAALLLALYWRRLPHRGLAAAAGVLSVLGLLGVALESSLALAGQVHWPRSGWPLVHWMSYGWLLPAVAAAWAAALFSRARPAAVWSAHVSGLCALVLGFAWVNIEVQNHFMHGDVFEFDHARLPARAFATSCAWALYAFALLVAGLRSRGGALRKASLVFLLAAIAKVFLYDLGSLTGLYRVGSLVGLAVALFAVSMSYQRFVFRRAPDAQSPDMPDADQA